MTQSALTPPPVFDGRRLGVLLHPSSLPGPGPKGGLGPAARRFVDVLVAAGVSVWQVLPLGPPGGGSPYNSPSAHAGDPGLISLDDLVGQGWLEASELQEAQQTERGRGLALRTAFRRFQDVGTRDEKTEFARFTERHAGWLSDYCLFECVKRECQGVPWWEWPREWRDRDPESLARRAASDDVQLTAFMQFVFFAQWHALKDYANERGVRIFGDIPIFVAEDSADVWAHREVFVLDSDGRPEIVTGVPPDYFSADGQRWGNPHYRWDRMAADGFAWWRERVRTQRELFDWIRVDHFRGFEAAWAIPFAAPTAVEGHWVPVPGDALLAALTESLGNLPLIAEDLGVITKEVYALRDRYGLPGMRVLQFAFDGDPENPHLPHNYVFNSVAYTGTHDNDTTVGWFKGLSKREQARVCEYLPGAGDSLPWAFIRAAIGSVAALAIIPWQDVLALGSDARMNTPGTSLGNWTFRFSWADVSEPLLSRLAGLASLYGRSP